MTTSEPQRPHAEPAPLVRFDQVGLRYGRGPDVLRDVSFDLPHGSLTFLTGPSGAGKTTLLKLVYLALTPSRGRVSVFGADAKDLRRRDLPDMRRRIGVVFQEFRLLDHLTAFNNVALPLRVAGQSLKTYREDVAELMAWVGLGDKLKASPATLSVGEQQRLAIARAVVAKPDLIIADEPTGNVDPDMARRLMRLFLELNRVGATLLIATHDQSLVQTTPHARTLRLDGGRLAATDAPALEETRT
ncbi:MAG: cell division ATP-binding protein FtsE [Maricaulaceae bacterium]